MAKSTRDRLAETTAHMLQHRGYHGSGLADLLIASSAPRGSLYFHFPGGKDELVAAATREGIEAVTETLRDSIAVNTSPGRAVSRLLEETAHTLASNDFRFGSPTAPLVLDGLDPKSEIAALTGQAYADWIGIFEAALTAAGVSARRARPLATLIEASFEGLLIVCRAQRDIAPMLAAAKELEVLVDAALPAKPKARGK